MVQTLEAIRGGGGSIRVGTTGTIGSLITRELDCAGATPHTPTSSTSILPNVPVSVSFGVPIPRGLQPKKPSDEASSSGSIKGTNHKSPEVLPKSKAYNGNSHEAPILGSDKLSSDRTPRREKAGKRGPHIVEIVDIKCGNPNRPWANPVANRLKKIGFSKLSESIA